MRPAPAGRAALGGVLALVLAAVPAAAGALGDVTRIAVSADVEHPVAGVSAAALERRLAAFVGALDPPLALDAASTDHLRLTVGVRAHDSSALRGFWLPFSGTYAIGTVRLGLERAVHLPGQGARTVPAIVWQRERPIATRWAAAAEAIAAAVAELLDELRQAEPGRR